LAGDEVTDARALQPFGRQKGWGESTLGLKRGKEHSSTVTTVSLSRPKTPAASGPGAGGRHSGRRRQTTREPEKHGGFTRRGAGNWSKPVE